MGNKIHPEGFRVGVYENWKSRWFAEKVDYAKNALEDHKIRKFLEKKLENAGLSKIEIERSISALHIKIHVSRPGVVIGRAGSGTSQLKNDLSKLTKSKIDLEVEDIKGYETTAALVAENIKRRIMKRFPYKRAMVYAASKAMEKGAKGIKIRCSGVLSGASSISRSEEILRGSIPLQTLRASIDYAQTVAETTYGTIGIKVWIYKGNYGHDA